MSSEKTVYISWQEPDTRSWHVVGCLSKLKDSYFFYYTKGARVSKKFIPFSGMEDLEGAYMSVELFPLFKNRVLSSKRPEYPMFINWIGLSGQDLNAIDLLGRSGGLRETDTLQVFKRLEIAEDGTFSHIIFSHGVGHLVPSVARRISSLVLGEQLFLCLDVQNVFDPSAIIIRSEKPAEILGYCPRYISSDLYKILKDENSYVKVYVENLADDAPSNYRLMCKLKGKVSSELKKELSNGLEYQPIQQELINHPVFSL